MSHSFTDANRPSGAAGEPIGQLEAAGLLAGLGARVPLIAAPMAGGPSTPRLVLAAAGARAFGFLAGGYKTTHQLAEQIAEVRRDTSCFGVNLFAPNPVPVERGAFTAYADALHELASSYGIDLTDAVPSEDDDGWHDKVDLLCSDPVPVVSFTFGLPTVEIVRRLRRAGSVTIQTVTNADEAQRAAALGIDGLVVQGCGAGGHSGTLAPGKPVEDMRLAALLERVRAKVDIPLWAAGGLSTAAGVKEVLAAGAEAAVVGTVLLRSPESGASQTYKAGLADPARTETVVTTAFSGRPARALRNRFTDQFGGRAPLGYPALHHLTSPIRKAAAAAGDAESINLWAGTGYRDATEEPAADILGRLAGDRDPSPRRRA